MAERCITRAMRWALRVNDSSTWRARLGDALRQAADLLDGRRSAAIAIESDPALSEAQLNRVMDAGWRCMHRALGIETRAEAEEAVFRELHPALFKVTTHGQGQ